MEQVITFAELDDFVFCPMPLYYHSHYKNKKEEIYKTTVQTKGSASHEPIDKNRYSNRKNVIQSLTVYSEKYNLLGKIDILFEKEKRLVERKRKVNKIYDGYIFQLYAQYFALEEMGYKIDYLEIYSISDNKTYKILKPEKDEVMLSKFENTITKITKFNPLDYSQENVKKCNNCIYRNLCGVIEC